MENVPLECDCSGNMDPDEFTFTFTDGEFVLGPDTFVINISFADRKGAWWLMR